MADTTRADNYIEAWRHYGGTQLRQHLEQAMTDALEALEGLNRGTFTEDDLTNIGRLRDIGNALVIEAVLAVTGQPKYGPRSSRISIRTAADLLGSSRNQLPLWAKQVEALSKKRKR